MTEDQMWGACQLLRPEITRAQFRLMWMAFMHERRRRARSRWYRWATNAWFWVTGGCWR
jgi:hypothetical protein